ncbi:uncharacterized protein LOC102701768 [Oryza brachyantha]|uniref:uncharacterized protein LOC102701768 n=1 Tax=Oryza brachyantha TaxID=4533 RepID=UPI001ADCDB4B|nr:uncharacterized protein LOC102701768 [Oryza brachyantha]
MAKLFLVAALLLAAAAAAPALASSSSSSSGDTNNTAAPTAYEMVERYGFPRGILPEGVQSYVLRPDGSFEVLLSGDGVGGGGDCEFRVGDGGAYLLRYGRRIAGNAREGSIRSLEGVSVKVLFAWLGIGQVDRAGDQLRFFVGPLSASFPLANFADCPRCRCGFDCAGGHAIAAAS